jgi:four helix bundle protein
MQDFRKLKVWQRAHALSLRIDALVAKFPRTAAGLRGQLSRAAASIASNIAEGSGAASQREFARYLDMSIKSCSETQYDILKAYEGHLIPKETFERDTDEVIQIRRMLHGLRKRVLEDLEADDGPETSDSEPGDSEPTD